MHIHTKTQTTDKTHPRTLPDRKASNDSDSDDDNDDDDDGDDDDDMETMSSLGVISQ